MVDTPQKPKHQKMAQAREDLEILMKAFPKCFTLKDPRPLKVGIKEDIFEKWGSEAPMNKTRFGHVVKGYTCTKRYLKSFENETYRYGMNGEQAQEIAEEARTHAKELLATIYKEGKKMGVKDITEISKQCLDNAGDKVKAGEKALSMLSVGKSIEEIQASTGLSEREVLELQGDF